MKRAPFPFPAFLYTQLSLSNGQAIITDKLMRWLKDTHDDKVRAGSMWYRWFAWYPVRFGPGPNRTRTVVWLETVECMGTYHPGQGDSYWTYEFREAE